MSSSQSERQPNGVQKVDLSTSNEAALRAEGITTVVGGPFDLCLASKELVTCSGRSGIGKSLFLRALADLDEHDGRVWCGSKEQAATEPTEWRRLVAWSPADSPWWAPTVTEHLSAPIDPERLGLASTILEADPRQLSAGERQRLALLRILAPGPRILLLDEPTSHCDPEAVELCEVFVTEWLQAGAGRAVLWMTHDRSQAERVGHRHLTLERNGLWEVAP